MKISILYAKDIEAAIKVRKCSSLSYPNNIIVLKNSSRILGNGNTISIMNIG
jgi:hypothetical protein